VRAKVIKTLCSNPAGAFIAQTFTHTQKQGALIFARLCLLKVSISFNAKPHAL